MSIAGQGQEYLGALLRSHRIMAGLSQQALAEASGVSVRAISNIERARTARPYGSSIRLLADALGLPDGAREELLRASRPSGDARLPQAGGGKPDDETLVLRPVIVPGQLPGGVPDFVGRLAELRALANSVDGEAQADAVVISSIDGAAGVGKTALALHWAHRVAGRFPDGQLHADLRGFSPEGRAADPSDVIRGFLDALGVPAERIPKGLDDGAALYRSALAGRRMLVVLDNARDEEQVRPLLPGSPGSVALVTSRRRLSGLIAIEGARPVTVDVLSAPEARELLSRRVGSGRITTEPEAVAELIERCGRLPLALAVAAARAAGQPTLSLSALAAELRDADSRLDALDAGDPRAGVRTVLSWSYQGLSRPAARMFRLLGVYPGPDIAAPAAASLAGIPRAEARAALDELTDAQLLAERSPGRYALHDLLRAYAAEQAEAAEHPAERRAALHRALDHYLHTAHAACQVLEAETVAESLSAVLASPQHGVTPERPGSYEQALAWFDSETGALLAAAARADDAGFQAHAWQIPCAAEVYFFRRGNRHGSAKMLSRAASAAESAGDTAGQALALTGLGLASLRDGAYAQATAHLSRSLDMYQKLGDRVAEARSHVGIGASLALQSRCGEALIHAQQARDLFREAGHTLGEAGALNNIGWYHARLDDYEQALAWCEQALAAFRGIGHRRGEATASDSLGYVHHRLGNHDRAIARGREAARIFRELGYRYEEAEALTHLGDAQEAAGDPRGACDSWEPALAILDDLKHPDADQLRVKLRSRRSAPASPTACATRPAAAADRIQG